MTGTAVSRTNAEPLAEHRARTRPRSLVASAPAPHTMFDGALKGTSTWLRLDDGRLVHLAAQRWQQPADRVDQWLLRRCLGPTLDLGCGPGRRVEALRRNGILALGVDCSALAVRQCLARDIPVWRGDVFADLPGERCWQHVLLADGNIGIGGDPLRLLRRAAALLTSTGTVLVETGPRRSGLWRGNALLLGSADGDGPWFPWATIGLNAIPVLAWSAGLRVVGIHSGHRRCFVELTRRDDVRDRLRDATGRQPRAENADAAA